MAPYISVPLILIGAGGLVFFWSRLIGMVAASGWGDLSNTFPDSTPAPPLREFKRMNVKIGNIELENFVDVDVVEAGLRLCPRFARPPALIPWSQVEKVASADVAVRHTPPIHILLPLEALERIRLHAPQVAFDEPDVESFINVIRRQGKA